MIVVEAEEKANVALRDVSFCKQDLEWSKKEVDQLKGTVKGLETQKDALIARIAEEEEANKEMLEELEDCRREAFALQQKATEAVETIDNALEQQLNDINQEASPARVRRRKHQNTMATKAHKNTNIGSLEDDALYESDQI